MTSHTSATPVITPAIPPVPSVHLLALSAQPVVPPTQPIQSGPMPHINWFHFKPELAGKPEEDAEAHLLRTND